jgi:hypothetical protein
VRPHCAHGEMSGTTPSPLLAAIGASISSLPPAAAVISSVDGVYDQCEGRQHWSCHDGRPGARTSTGRGSRQGETSSSRSLVLSLLLPTPPTLPTLAPRVRTTPTPYNRLPPPGPPRRPAPPRPRTRRPELTLHQHHRPHAAAPSLPHAAPPPLRPPRPRQHPAHNARNPVSRRPTPNLATAATNALPIKPLPSRPPPLTHRTSPPVPPRRAHSQLAPRARYAPHAPPAAPQPHIARHTATAQHTPRAHRLRRPVLHQRHRRSSPPVHLNPPPSTSPRQNPAQTVRVRRCSWRR